MSSGPKKKTKPRPSARLPQVRTRTPRPDELTRETFEFIAAVDQYKRRHMRSFLDDEEVLEVLLSLGYGLVGESRGPEPTESQLSTYAAARQRYRVENGRLFPSWSEIFGLLLELGYRRDAAA